MTLKEQEAQINRMQKRISQLVEELRITQADVKTFKGNVARDMKRAFEQIAEQNKVGF
jgi:hypothetical protein